MVECRKQNAAYRAEEGVGVGQALQPNWELDVAGTNNVLNLEVLFMMFPDTSVILQSAAGTISVVVDGCNLGLEHYTLIT